MSRSISTEDRVSSLPDPIICHILSFLPTKTAASTSILSKRWNLLWLTVPILHFDDETFQNFASFCHFVYSVFILRDITLPLRSFHLKCSKASGIQSQDINRFVHAAVQRGIENLNLELSPMITLPRSIFSCRTLVVLHLKWITVKDLSPLVVDFPLLKKLHLSYLILERAEYIIQLLSGCSILEELHAERLIVKNNEWLVSLNFLREKCPSLLKLITANITKSTLSLTRLLTFLCRKSQLLRADLGTRDLKLQKFPNLINIELILKHNRCEKWNWLLKALKDCPKLQNLTIHEDFENGEEVVDNWVYPTIIPECLSTQLKTCLLKGYECTDCELQFAKYIMQNSKVLNTMSIKSGSSVDTNVKHQILKKLASCTRASSTYVSDAIDTITSTHFIKDPETLSSKSGNFTLGFFSPENSTNRYVGIWWQPQFTILWVLNRDQPLKDSSGVVKISDDGNDLVVLNGKKEVIWTSNAPNVATNSSSKLLDSGNLVLLEGTTERTMWESFQHPSNVMLPNMKLTSNKITGEKVKQTSWKTPYDPSIGSFSLSVERLTIPEVFIWNENQPYWRTGPWNGKIFTGLPYMTTHYLGGLHVGDDGEGNVSFFQITSDTVGLIIYNLSSEGNCEEKWWDEKKKEWKVTWNSHEMECDVYGVCGHFASCNSQSSPICSCLKGFEPRNKEEWNKQNWTEGCVRRTPLQQCERYRNQNTSEDSNADGFLKLPMVKVPDFADGSSLTLSSETCKSQCLENCSCVAYSYDADIGCMSWTGNLVDIQKFSNGGLDLYIRVAHTELDKEKNMKFIIITITVLTGTVIVLACAYIMWRRRTNHHATIRSDNAIGELSQVKLQELLLFNFGKLATATNNFHSSNKLGQGGFGPVYKGTMHDGQEIAVKRLSKASGQGLKEFMNEVAVISKLQHRNLVKLLGCCVDGEEKMLIYEYMPNKSLDAFLFDASKSKILDWRKRFSIIEGIARGLLYLHRDSRLKIIHRDLKPSNILLDNELNPKISDFGMARIFGGSEDQENTRRVVGTYGYMSPEYAMQGLFSDKSDVFSFGVLLLEIISGRRNSSFYDCDSLTLLGFVWIQWQEGNILPLIDPEIYDHIHHKYITRSIHIGLLCVQEFSIDRPTMAAVISMLNSDIVDLPPPKKPAFILKQNMLSSVSPEENNDDFYSVNLVSISDIHGR